MAPAILHESPENGSSRAPALKPTVLHITEKGSHTNVVNITSLDISAIPFDTVCRYQLSLSATALGSADIPIFAYRSSNPGPTVGITCAVHGNEVNGIPVIQQLFRDVAVQGEDYGIEPFTVDRGTLIGIPVVNVPGFLASIRCFDEDSKQDLNRLMPGKKDGSAPQQYVYAFFNKVVVHLDYLIDLHTASPGRRNSLYARVDMSHPEIAQLAKLLEPQIIVHVATGGSLRGCAQARGIRALTVEVSSTGLPLSSGSCQY